MASTKADNNRVAWKYTDDLGTDWSVSAKAVYVLDVTDGSKFGGEAADAVDRAKPTAMRMRAVKCVAASGAIRYVPAYTTTATIWTTPGTTVTLDLNGVDTVFEAKAGHRGERYRDGIRQVA